MQTVPRVTRWNDGQNIVDSAAKRSWPLVTIITTSRCLSSLAIQLSWGMRAKSFAAAVGISPAGTMNAAWLRPWSQCSLVSNLKNDIFEILMKFASPSRSTSWLIAILVLCTLPCFCIDVAVLKNGFSIKHERRESVGDTTRLYMTADGGSFV